MISSLRCMVMLVGVLVCAAIRTEGAIGFIGLRDGYFYDKETGEPWVSHGIAYQTWNRPLGVWQTPEQIDYDLDEMVKMGANSIRVDFVWKQIEEKGDNQFEWDNYDYLIQAAEQRGIRIFALIGYQWPPDWFPDAWYTQHPPAFDSEGLYHPTRWQSDIINYEHPQARAQYAEWFQNVCSRYKDSKAIVGWIIGNESGYLGLWSGLQDGYDPESEAAFRQWVIAQYGTLENVNAQWGTGYTAWTDIVFVNEYTPYGPAGAVWANMVQWREDSIGTFTAIGAKAAKMADTNHLISYSTVGMQWGEEDWRYHAEDRGKITSACAATNAPIDFFSVNNYPWSILGHESQNGQWGISFTKFATRSPDKPDGVPVVYSETGFTSSETMWPGMNIFRQGPLVRNALWESLEAGAIGTHVFSWMDRPYITDREKGFGILYADRRIKPAFWTCKSAFNMMEQVDIHAVLDSSKDPKPDIAFLWTAAVDSQYNRYECEMQQMAGAFERLGFEPNFINLADLAAGAYTNYQVLVLPRNMRVDSAVPGFTNSVLNFLLNQVIPQGVHILASADLPGMQNENGRPRDAFTNEVAALFGIDAKDPGGHEVAARTKEYVSSFWRLIDVTFNTNAGALAGYACRPFVWKYSDEIEPANGGVVWATMDTGRNKGFEDSDTGVGAWQSLGKVSVISNEPTQAFEGRNYAVLNSNACIWADFPVMPDGRYTAGAYLRNNPANPLNGVDAYVALEWRDKSQNLLGISESAHMTAGASTSVWQKYSVDALAPSNAYSGRRIIRVGYHEIGQNLLRNPSLSSSGAGLPPANWEHEGVGTACNTEFGRFRESPNSMAFWHEGMVWQDVYSGFEQGDQLTVGGWLYTPSSDALRGGSKYGAIVLEFRNSTEKYVAIATNFTPTIDAGSSKDEWINVETRVIVPPGTTFIRVLARCYNYTSGDGWFMADDLYLRRDGIQTSGGQGAVLVDNNSRAPAVVVKNHGPAKAAIFLYTSGDMAPDGTLDGNPDVYAWQWRYDIFGILLKNCFGAQPSVTLSGTNAFLCMPEYRTLSDGSTLWQIKNYMYDTNYPASWESLGGGEPQTFTLQSDLFFGKTIEALYGSRVIEENSDGTINLSLPPDGMEMLLVYDEQSTVKPYPDGSSDGRMSHGMNDRSGRMTGPSTNFPLTAKWSSYVSGTPVVAGKRVYIANSWQGLVCLDVLTGDYLWSYGGGSFFGRSVAVADGTVFVATKQNAGTTGYLHAVDAYTGAFKWKHAGASYSCSAPVVADGVVYFGGVGDRMHAADAETGAILWESTNFISSTDYGSVTLANGRLYTFGRSTLYCLDAQDGRTLWSRSNVRSQYAETPPVVANGFVYAANNSGYNVSVFDAVNGTSCVSYTTGLINSKYTTPAVDAQRMYIAAAGVLQAFDATIPGSTPLWQASVSGYSPASVAIADGVVYVSADSLMAFDAVTGALLWQTSGKGSSCTAPYVRNGWAFFATDSSGLLTAYSDGSAWPDEPVAAANQIVCFKDAPSAVHPVGDKSYQILIGYDCRGREDLMLKVAFGEDGDNGDGLTNEIYQALSASVGGAGEHEFWMWIPDADANDSDYLSTAEGGSYEFNAWLEDTNGVHVAEALPVATQLKWGVRPTEPLPTELNKGDQVQVPVKWEGLNEYLPWENTPLTRNDDFPSRVALVRSAKTEAQFPGHFGRCNQVANWLESLGYQGGNPLDISFDNIKAVTDDGFAAGPFVLEAETMATQSGGVAMPTRYDMWSSGLVEDSLEFPRAGVYRVTIRAFGSICQGEWPLMELHVDGVAVSAFYVRSAQYEDYSVLVEVPAGARNVGVAFVNDAYVSPEEDRNLYVDKVTIASGQPFDGLSVQEVETMPTRGPDTYPISGGASICGYSYIEGPVTFETTGDYEFTIRAFGSTCQGEWPQMEVRVDGTTVVTRTIGSTDYSNYVATVAMQAGAHTVTLAFVNDCNMPPEDRNLYLDKIVFRDLSKGAVVADDFGDGEADGWSRAAGCANWVVTSSHPFDGRQILEVEDATTMNGGVCRYRIGAGYGYFDGACLYSSGYIEEALTFETSGPHEFLFTASGRPANGEWPRLDLFVDGVMVTSLVVNTTNCAVFSATVPVTEGSRMIRIRFDNDFYAPPEDRNLYVDRVVIRDLSKEKALAGGWAVETLPANLLSDLAGYWKFDETSWAGMAGEVLDSSGAGNPGQSFSGACITDDARQGKAGYFDGTNAYVEVPNSASLQVAGNLTISFWIKPWNVGLGRINPVDKNYGGEFSLTIEEDHSLNFYQGTARAADKYSGWSMLPGGSLSNGVWQHVVITRDVGTRVLLGYLNGTLIQSWIYYDDTNSLPSASTYPVRIGQGYTANALGGAMDEVKIFTNVLNATDVANEYRAGLQTKILRASRIGNSDNIMVADANPIGDCTVSADILYNRQDKYFSDAELYLRYVDRDNFVKVGIRNYYGFWRLKYTVRASTNIVSQGWICDFAKTNRPVENVWYNLKVQASNSAFTVFFDNVQVGSFMATNFASGKIGVGASATQLGNWEPQKGYFFVDDDEYSFWAPEGQAQDEGKLVNLDYGYLGTFFPTLILPGVYAMNDIEVSNVVTWLNGGLRCLIATDGGVAMKDETGANDPGRIEDLFGVAPVVTNLAGLTGAGLSDDQHYVTLDYHAGDTLAASGSAIAWPLVTDGQALGYAGNATHSVPALIVNTLTNDPLAPKKVFCFNFGVDTSNQLTGAFSQIARRALEWAQGETYKIRLELKYTINTNQPGLDLSLLSVDGWVLQGSGANTLIVNIPSNGIMTGDNLYWVMYVYPWDASDPWLAHNGFYSTVNDTGAQPVSLAGKGLQILGATDHAYAGRDWDIWTAYNTRGESLTLTHGIKDIGFIQNEDNFRDGVLDGWTAGPQPNNRWTIASNGVLHAATPGTGYSLLMRDGLNVGNSNITIEYDVKVDGNVMKGGGLVYRGYMLNANAQGIWWDADYVAPSNFSGVVTNADGSVSYVVTGGIFMYIGPPGLTTGVWHHVVVSIRNGSPVLRSDVYVDGLPQLLDTPLPGTNYTSATAGFLSAYENGTVDYDNFRVVDEEYSFVDLPVVGARVPTNDADVSYYSWIPDYDPAWSEFRGTTHGTRQEWYSYLRGEGVEDMASVALYFAPRLLTERADFPTNFNAGQTVSVPVEWENVDALPARLVVALQDARTGGYYCQQETTINIPSGQGNFTVTVNDDAPSGSKYLWVAYMYPVGAADPWAERIGFDDTYRGDKNGTPIEPEVTIKVTGSNGVFTAYSDLGLPAGADAYTWGTGSHNGNYTNVPAPEGTMSWLATGGNIFGVGDYVGWGVVFPHRTIDLSDFNYVKFWVRTHESLKVEMEAARGDTRTVCLDQGRWDSSRPDDWQEVTIHKSAFGFPWGPYEVYSPLKVTLVTPDRQAVDFVDANTGWMVGTGAGRMGQIRKSTDGGVTWQMQPMDAVGSLYAVDFLNANDGYVAGWNYVGKTINGGQTWTQLTNGLPASNYYKSVFLLDAQTGWVCGAHGYILKTVNGGASWTTQRMVSSHILNRIFFVDANNGWACGRDLGGNGLMLHTTDGGQTWTSQTISSRELFDIHFFDANNGWTCGEDTGVFRTSNGGTTWTSVSTPCDGSTCDMRDMAWVDNLHGYISAPDEAGSMSRMLRTTDGGNTWLAQQAAKGLYGLCFTDLDSGVAVGANSTVVRCDALDGNGAPIWQNVSTSRSFLIDHIRWTQNP